MKKIYIATKFQRGFLAKAVCERLEQQGYVCTFKWWETIDETKGGKPEEAHTPKELHAIGQRTRQAIIDADVVLYLGGAGPSYGSLVEVGMAYAFNKRLVVLEPSLQNQNSMHFSPFFATNPGLAKKWGPKDQQLSTHNLELQNPAPLPGEREASIEAFITATLELLEEPKDIHHNTPA